ncbi:GH1 family beta-glucosidase [Kallotenue papyrolyticum]|uniref:GH1 family beta-glucosidase n=1 Tax=Kallotenue papyrolyticum TaxID=1325125 RepID=UPI0004925F88|nr:GH1 family beta-glucosidase [Kallotenue papyrolyticum]
MPDLVFPSNFIWGVATSAYQIEGAAQEDGRGESIWDRFCQQPGAIEDGSSGAVACDHYHRWREDIELMRELGVQAYRFSIAWPRILPQGFGRVNRAGIDFYQRLVDRLLEVGITPFVTLYHWDLPQTLQERGGWTARLAAEAFLEYAEVVSRHLGDRVKHWITINEPWCASLLSYQIGRHAPGYRNWYAALSASHHLLVAHGLAVPVIRSNSRGAEVGITLNLKPCYPASPSAADRDACRHFDGSFNRWFLDPLFGRRYPADIVADYQTAGYLPAGDLPFVQDQDYATIAVRTDFLGVNYYDRAVLRNTRIPEVQNEPRTVWLAPESEWTAMGWEVYPQGLFDLLARLHFEYQPPKLYITENGASYRDELDGRGEINDQQRIVFLRDHFAAAHRALTLGVPLVGYFVWSLLDNFEWDRGYTQRFGIVYVDYATQQRLPKRSAHWYREVIRTNAVPLDAVASPLSS